MSSPFSLQRLSSAFARLMGGPAVETPPPPEGAADDIDDDDEGVLGESTRSVTPRKIVEAMLFVGKPDGQPLSPREMAAAIRDVEPDHIDELVQQLNALYREQQAALEIASVAGGYRMQLRPDLHRRRFVLQGRMKAARLSASAVETLSVVAYRQGVAASEVDRLRGSKSRMVLDQLVRRQLLRVERGADAEGPRYYTTPRFERLLGVRTLEELPRLAEWDDPGE